MNPAYIKFDMGGHEYTATVHDIEALERFLARNRDRIKNYSVETFGDLYPGDITKTMDAFLGDDADEPPEGVWGPWRYFDEWDRAGRWTKSHLFPLNDADTRQSEVALCGAAPEPGRPVEFASEYEEPEPRCKLCLRELGE